MAYYTGISGMQSFAQDPNQSQPFTQLGSNNYNVAPPVPAPNAQPTLAGGKAAGSSNPITNTALQSQTPGDTNLSYAKDISGVPMEVQQAAQPYLSGSSGYGDPSQSLFGRNLTSNYNNWTSQYGQTGQQFMPWALRQGIGGGNYDPSQVDLFNPIAGKTPTYNFNPGAGTLMSQNSYYNPISGATDAAAAALQTGNPAYSLSRNYQDINPNYIANQFGKWTAMGATGLPSPTNYASQYYMNLQPNFNGNGSDYTNWYQNGLQNNLLPQSYLNNGISPNQGAQTLKGGPGSATSINLGHNLAPTYGQVY